MWGVHLFWTYLLLAGVAAEKITYEVYVTTGTLWWAGTDSDVFLKMFGSNGASHKIELDSIVDDFERGKTDVFKIEALNVGKLSKIEISNKNSLSGWFLEEISIITPRMDGKQFRYQFVAQRWMKKPVIEIKLSTVETIDKNLYLVDCDMKMIIRPEKYIGVDYLLIKGMHELKDDDQLPKKVQMTKSKENNKWSVKFYGNSITGADDYYIVLKKCDRCFGVYVDFDKTGCFHMRLSKKMCLGVTRSYTGLWMSKKDDLKDCLKFALITEVQFSELKKRWSSGKKYVLADSQNLYAIRPQGVVKTKLIELKFPWNVPAPDYQLIKVKGDNQYLIKAKANSWMEVSDDTKLVKFHKSIELARPFTFSEMKADRNQLCFLMRYNRRHECIDFGGGFYRPKTFSQTMSANTGLTPLKQSYSVKCRRFCFYDKLKLMNITRHRGS